MINAAELKSMGILLYEDCRIERRSVLSCEKRVMLGGRYFMSGSIGAYTYIRYGSRMGLGVKSIGRFCSIAPGVVAGDGNHPTDWLSTHPFQWGNTPLLANREEFRGKLPKLRSSWTKIGNDVWIGASAMIVNGASVGDGAIVAAGAIVTKDVPPYAIVAGVPARIMRYRFSEPLIKRLLKLKWWNYEPEGLLGVEFGNIELALDQITKRVEEGTLKRLPKEIVKIGYQGTLESDEGDSKGDET